MLLTFPASSPVKVSLNSLQRKPINLLIAPPTIDALHMLVHLHLEISPWKSCRFQLNIYFLQKVLTDHRPLQPLTIPGRSSSQNLSNIQHCTYLCSDVCNDHSCCQSIGPMGVEHILRKCSLCILLSKHRNEWTNRWMNELKKARRRCTYQWVCESFLGSGSLEDELEFWFGDKNYRDKLCLECLTLRCQDWGYWRKRINHLWPIYCDEVDKYLWVSFFCFR